MAKFDLFTAAMFGGSGGSIDYGSIENAPMEVVTETMTAAEATDTGLFLGQIFHKVSSEYYDVQRMLGVQVKYTESDEPVTYGAENVLNLSDILLILGVNSGGSCVSPAGDVYKMDYVIFSMESDINAPDYGIILTKGTYIYDVVESLTLKPAVIIDPAYAGVLLPTVGSRDEGKTLGVANGKWAVSGKLSTYGIEDWSRIQRVLRNETAQVSIPVWSQIRVPHKVFGDIVFDVMGHNIDKDPNDSSRHTMTLYMRDCLRGFEFDATEALCVCPSGLAAGSYYASSGSDTLSWTLTQAIPNGGALAFNVNLMADGVSSISSYASVGATTPIETASVSTSETGTDIITAVGAANFNNFERAAFGSGNWAQSGIRQWLNGTGSGWWMPQTRFDRPPAYLWRDGFLAGFPEDFVSALVATTQVTNTNTVYEESMTPSTSSEPVTYNTTDKFFLPSWTQVHASQWNGQADENTVWTAFADTDTGSSEDRVKKTLTDGTPWYYWLRSCDPWFSCGVRFVRSGGDPGDYGNALSPGLGAAAACVIAEI